MDTKEKGQRINEVADIWHDSKESNKKFFKEVFGVDIDTNIPVPYAIDDFTGLLYVPQIKADLALQAYKKLFGEDSVYADSYSKNIDKKIYSQQSRPGAPYFIRHRNGLESDTIHQNKSYNVFYRDGNKYMIPLEGILFALYRRWNTGEMIDSKGETRFCALSSLITIITMYYSDKVKLNIESRLFRTNHYSGSGPREVHF